MLPDLSKVEITDFRGAENRLDSYSVPGQNALQSQNVRYTTGQVATRFGHSVMFTTGDIITAFVGWLFNVFGQPKNWFFYYAAGIGIRAVDLGNIGGGALTWIPQTTAYGAALAPAGSRIYIAFQTAAGGGDTAAQVFSYTGSNEPLFAGPVNIAPVVSESAAGLVTAGVHRFGYLLTTKNGFTTRPSPDNGSFQPVEFTSSGGKNVHVVVSGFWPSYASEIQIIMTTSSNLNKYFLVPGAIVSVPPSQAFSVLVDISISDDDLAADATEALPFFGLLTADAAGRPPFIPYNLVNYSSRMGYTTLDATGLPVTYFSDPDNYQSLTAATSGVYLPGNLQQTVVAPLRGVAYIFGPHWTHSTSDNGKTPVQWAKPQLVDGSIGTLSPRGVFPNTAQGFLWVCDTAGLYLFSGGQYPSRPISYNQQNDWDRINWQAARCVSVVDDSENKVVQVLAPLDGATTPTHRLTWNYAKGTDTDTAKYSIYDYVGQSFGIVEHPSTLTPEVWIGPAVAGAPVVRQNDGEETKPYRDVAAAINSIYEGALAPGQGGPHGFLHQHHGDHLRVSGNGTMLAQAFAVDHAAQTRVIKFPLALKPGKEYLVKYYLEDEHASLQLQTNAVDEFFILAKQTHYYAPASTQR